METNDSQFSYLESRKLVKRWSGPWPVLANSLFIAIIFYASWWIFQDPRGIMRMLRCSDIARDQVRGGDVLVVNKIDQVDPAAVERLDACLRQYNPTAPLLHTHHVFCHTFEEKHGISATRKRTYLFSHRCCRFGRTLHNGMRRQIVEVGARGGAHPSGSGGFF